MAPDSTTHPVLYPNRMGRKALLLPVLAFLVAATVPVLFGSLPEWLISLCFFGAGLLLLGSIPFGAWVAWSGRKTNRRQSWSGLGGCALGLGLSAYMVLAMLLISQKAEAAQKALEAIQAADSQNLPGR